MTGFFEHRVPAARSLLIAIAAIGVLLAGIAGGIGPAAAQVGSNNSAPGTTNEPTVSYSINWSLLELTL